MSYSISPVKYDHSDIHTDQPHGANALAFVIFEERTVTVILPFPFQATDQQFSRYNSLLLTCILFASFICHQVQDVIKLSFCRTEIVLISTDENTVLAQGGGILTFSFLRCNSSLTPTLFLLRLWLHKYQRKTSSVSLSDSMIPNDNKNAISTDNSALKVGRFRYRYCNTPSKGIR